jgi:hypothetical protein
MKNVIQNGGDWVRVGDNHYWGIMSSNGSKNMTFDGCVISRFDAHRGFWNATLKDTVIGHTINVVGGGTMILDNVTKLTGTQFIALRGDYGATFRGDMTIKDCTLIGHKTYDNNYNEDPSSYASAADKIYIINPGFQSGENEHKGHYATGKAADFPYLKWDFGYLCYMPQNVVVDNFQLGPKCLATKVYLYTDIGNNAFLKPKDFITPGEEYHMIQHTNPSTGFKYDVRTDIAEQDIYYNQYQITKSITYKNMKKLPICPAAERADNDYYSIILSIPTSGGTY